RRNEASRDGTNSARHGRWSTFAGIPGGRARPWWRKSAGETTCTASPRARSASTVAAMKPPEMSSSSCGYEVVRTRTRIVSPLRRAFQHVLDLELVPLRVERQLHPPHPQEDALDQSPVRAQ